MRHLGMLVASLMYVAVAGAGAYAGFPPHQLAAAAPPDGAAIYRTYCASCHGTTATGGGPAALSMKVTPPDLTGIAARNKGVFPSERVSQIVLGRGPAAHGDRNMPVWGDVFARRVSNVDPKAIIDALVRYLDGLQRRPA
jgi:mono/diheme cytochrome c family protein